MPKRFLTISQFGEFWWIILISWSIIRKSIILEVFIYSSEPIVLQPKVSRFFEFLSKFYYMNEIGISKNIGQKTRTSGQSFRHQMTIFQGINSWIRHKTAIRYFSNIFHQHPSSKLEQPEIQLASWVHNSTWRWTIKLVENCTILFY